MLGKRRLDFGSLCSLCLLDGSGQLSFIQESQMYAQHRHHKHAPPPLRYLSMHLQKP